VVSTATFKLDGLFFFLGVLFGVFAFGETEKYFDGFWHSGYYGRLTLMDVFHLPTGVVVLLVVCMALFMFWGGEQLERIFGKRNLAIEPRLRYAGAGALVLVALAVLLIGQPTSADKWTQISSEKEAALANREVQIQPGELLASIANDSLKVILLDVRSESDFNLFHIHGARNIQTDQVKTIVPELLREPAGNTVYVVMSNDEQAATEAWKLLVAESVANVYILEGGVNNWIKTFAEADPYITPTPTPPGNDQLGYRFTAALGGRYEASNSNPLEYNLEYTPKIKLQLKRSPSGGGCG
jgi:rhodanese-related sulfurtransferase